MSEVRKERYMIIYIVHTYLLLQTMQYIRFWGLYYSCRPLVYMQWPSKKTFITAYALAWKRPCLMTYFQLEFFDYLTFFLESLLHIRVRSYIIRIHFGSRWLLAFIEWPYWSKTIHWCIIYINIKTIDLYTTASNRTNDKVVFTVRYTKTNNCPHYFCH